jgi:hypothetical protein
MASIHTLAAITSLAAADEFVVYQNSSGNDKRIAISNVIANGTWSPDLQFGGGKTGLTYSSVGGLYVRVGRLITVNCVFTLSAKGSSTGDAVVQDSSGILAGLGTPTTVGTGVANFGTMTTSILGMQVLQSGVAFYLQGLTAAGVTMNTLTHAAFANTTTIRFTLSYFI